MSNVLDELLKEVERKVELERRERQRDREAYESSLKALSMSLTAEYQKSMKQFFALQAQEQKALIPLLEGLLSQQKRIIEILQQPQYNDKLDNKLKILFKQLGIELEIFLEKQNETLINTLKEL